MEAIPSIMAQNLLSPIVLSFALGLFASLARSNLSVPEAAAKALSLYLLFAIGFKGGRASRPTAWTDPLQPHSSRASR